MSVRAAAVAALLTLGACTSPPIESDSDRRVRAAEETLAASPRLYPVWAELGEARLAQAGVSRDPEHVRLAREAFERSLAIQPNFVALRGMTALANFRHRFDEALEWSERAAAAYPEDSSVLAMRIEALVSSGRLDDAERWLAEHPPRADDFHARAAVARVACARGRIDAAAAEYLAASKLARAQAPKLAQWAGVRAAAAYIDSGQPERASALLEDVVALDPLGVDVQVHLAEVDEALGRAEAALERYEHVLEHADDPTVHAAAARVARELGDETRANRHFETARAAFQRAIDAGEQYTLGMLARLYTDAGVEPEEAARLAHAHAQVVRDQQSRDLLERVAAPAPAQSVR